MSKPFRSRRFVASQTNATRAFLGGSRRRASRGKPWELFAAGCSSTKNKSRFSQRALSNIIHCSQWLIAKKNVDSLLRLSCSVFSNLVWWLMCVYIDLLFQWRRLRCCHIRADPCAKC